MSPLFTQDPNTLSIKYLIGRFYINYILNSQYFSMIIWNNSLIWPIIEYIFNQLCYISSVRAEDLPASTTIKILHAHPLWHDWRWAKHPIVYSRSQVGLLYRVYLFDCQCVTRAHIKCFICALHCEKKILFIHLQKDHNKTERDMWKLKPKNIIITSSSSLSSSMAWATVVAPSPGTVGAKSGVLNFSAACIVACWLKSSICVWWHDN